jgi:ribosomal protein L40E
MKCPRCEQDNPAHARFCLGCGARLALACSSCGAELPGDARFCLQCGQAVAAGTAASVRSPAPEAYTPKLLAEKILTSKAALEGERKQVTVLFADLKGSMELLADRDPEEARPTGRARWPEIPSRRPTGRRPSSSTAPAIDAAPEERSDPWGGWPLPWSG